jgi:hypothetical protein
MAAPTKKTLAIYEDSTLIGPLAQVESGWFDLTKRSARMWVTRKSTPATYVLEVDWSRDAGATYSTEQITTTSNVTALIPGRHRWVRFRIKNTHSTLAFTTHDTFVEKDAGAGG